MKIGDIAYVVRPQTNGCYAYQVKVLGDRSPRSNRFGYKVNPLFWHNVSHYHHFGWGKTKVPPFWADEDYLFPTWEEAQEVMKSNFQNTREFQELRVENFRRAAERAWQTVLRYKETLQEFLDRGLSNTPPCSPEPEKYISPFTAEEK